MALSLTAQGSFPDDSLFPAWRLETMWGKTVHLCALSIFTFQTVVFYYTVCNSAIASKQCAAVYSNCTFTGFGSAYHQHRKVPNYKTKKGLTHPIVSSYYWNNSLVNIYF